MSLYRRDIYETEYISFLMRFQKNIMASKNNSIKKGFDIETVYNEKYVKP